MMTIFIVYVYDIIIIGDNHDKIGELKQLLAMEFEVKYLGQLKCFLGVEVAQSKHGVYIS